MTDVPAFHLERSSLDEARFGIQAARAFVTTIEEVTRVLTACRKDGTSLLIVRCPSAEIGVAQALEDQGARLMDTLVYFVAGLSTPRSAANANGLHIRESQPGDMGDVSRIAREAFRDYVDHYHADPRLSRETCDEVYENWAARSVEQHRAHQPVLVAEWEGSIVGFITLRSNHPGESEVVLNAVAPAHQRHGVNSALFHAAMRWSAAQGMSRIVVSTQINNVAAQRVWTRLGFEPSHSLYTFHRWFDQRDKT